MARLSLALGPHCARAGASSGRTRGRLAVTLHFAYGSNMSRAMMGARCPGARALGTATLPGWRFVVNPDGGGSIALAPGALPLGVLWRVGLRALVSIHAHAS